MAHSWADNWALITGAACGIGEATARAFAQRGAGLILADIRRAEVDRVGDELREMGAEVFTYGVDVASLEKMSVFAHWVAERVGAVDVLVNNAGIVRHGGYEQTSFEDWRAVFDVNLFGVVHATKLLVPPMVERGQGAVVNIASASGQVGFSKLTAYSTSKFALMGFSQALRGELQETGVSVSVVCPGFVKTGIADHAPMSKEQRQAANELLEQRGMPASKVADAIIHAAESGTAEINVGADAKVLGWASRISPFGTSAWLSRMAKD